MKIISLRVEQELYDELERMAVNFYGYQAVIVDPDTEKAVDNPISIKNFLKQVLKDKVLMDVKAYRRGLSPIDMSDAETQIT